ncbi:MAG: lysophospholipid acyltransferase family protein [Limosilactobacillus oris]|jgi:KDO2-lipid IV(A) lauroyltransferase|uniref:Lysophospholipid acyltransferase family protein n=1 Tax=Megasphaera intestinihominis TaxID=3133159 RepID=A0ABV1CT05_9FIRM|nr:MULTISPECIES: lysophospholipid acyltransferase family protein [unclassified Megasphaera]MCH3903600.1 lysophospholipid acyltransferase family protein [Limosilactobacillus oris]MCI1887366.1 lysophospholipid acyltransferase family protein [Sporolactobacillus sp.]MCI1905230.1 lysophospholipid acyltransferase family protein [Enterococcaceae bacterium]EPP16120.1 lipid A biosynthesis (KDO)2-(lauroyl)-lipid IVA acyltransferase [Megasphaera sp. BL7]EPP19037.1 lipid A biosynthesis (KDO)2-(lauroyl)-li
MYTFMKCLSWIICHIPEGCRRALGTFLGAFFWTFVPKKRKVLAQQQILDCGLTDDPEKAMAIAKASTVRFGPMIIEVLSYPRYTKEMLDEKITWHGKEYLDELKASGEGAVFMASHAGNWELLGAVLAMNGYPLISVAQEQNSKSADTFINEYRAMMKQHVTYKTGIRDMVRFLRDGHYIGLLMDQDPGYTGIMVKLFGMDTLTADGPAKMAGIANYPIVSTFIHEDRPYHHVVEVLPPIKPYTADHKLSKEEKNRIMYETTQELNDRLEAHIRKYPEDWFWLHNRWKWTKRYKIKQAEKGAGV